MIEIDFDDLIDATMTHTLKESIELQERWLDEEYRFPIWFKDEVKDKAAVNHLIHCMKVVHDWYAMPSDGFYFDYTIARKEYENSSNS